MKMTRVITYEGSSEWIASIQKNYCELVLDYAWSVGASVSDGGGGTITERYRTFSKTTEEDVEALLDWAEDEDFRLTERSEANRINGNS